MDALATQMDALQQEMYTIQRQVYFQKKTSPSINTKTHTSIDKKKATSQISHASIDSTISTPIDDRHPKPHASIRDEIFNIIKMDNQWEEESLKKKLDVFYCRLDNNLNWVTKKGELLQKMDMLRNKKENQHKQSPSIDTDDSTSIDMDTSWNDGWNTEFQYKPKCGVKAYNTYQRKKRSWRYIDTS